MTRTLAATLFALFIAAPAAAAPGKLIDNGRPNVTETMNNRPLDFTCNTGGASGLLVAAAAVGLFARKRR